MSLARASVVEPLITARIDANLYYGQNLRSAWDVENSHCWRKLTPS
jgi:hypothetical protein